VLPASWQPPLTGRPTAFPPLEPSPEQTPPHFNYSHLTHAVADCCHREFADGCSALQETVRNFAPEVALGVDWSASAATLNALGNLQCPYVYLCYRQGAKLVTATAGEYCLWTA